MRYGRRYYEVLYAEKIVKHAIQRCKYIPDYNMFNIQNHYTLTFKEVYSKVPPPYFVSMMWNRYCLQNDTTHKAVWLQLRKELLQMKTDYYDEEMRKLRVTYDKLPPKTKFKISSAFRKMADMVGITK